MSVPLYQAEVEFFRMPGHPVRPQRPAVSRRSGIGTSRREGSTVVHVLASGDVDDPLRAARRILTEVLTGRNERLAELRDGEVVTR